MIIQPQWGTRNVNEYFYKGEARRIAALNEIFGDVDLSAAEMRTGMAGGMGGKHGDKCGFDYP